MNDSFVRSVIHKSGMRQTKQKKKQTNQKNKKDFDIVYCFSFTCKYHQSDTNEKKEHNKKKTLSSNPYNLKHKQFFSIRRRYCVP